MNHTSQYALSQWEETDRILMEDFNADNAKIEAALASQAGTLATKAAQSALNAESSARQKADSAINNALALRGNCQVYHTTYAGSVPTGSPQASVTLTFPHKPMAVFIGAETSTLVAVQGAERCQFYDFIAGLSWSGNSLTFSHKNLNIKGVTYHVTALLDITQ